MLENGMMRFDTEMICIFRPKFRVKEGLNTHQCDFQVMV